VCKVKGLYLAALAWDAARDAPMLTVLEGEISFKRPM
jgi:hypothetical protein